MVSFVKQFDLPFQSTTNVKLNFVVGKHEIYFCLRLLQEISPTSTEDVDNASWFLDCGATHHVTSHCDSLTSKTEYSSNGKLMVDDGTELPISNIGKFDLPDSSTSSKPLTLRNILLVKDKHTRDVLLKGTLNNGLYQLQLP